MAGNISEQKKRSKVSVYLKQHEQMSAWLFFTIMATLVMYCSGYRGIALLHTPLLGIMLLYILKLASLYIRRSTAWAVSCAFFALTPFCSAHPAELSMCLQFVVLYHVLGWARGKRAEFRPRHFFVLGMAAGVALLSRCGAEIFYIPVGLLMLWINRRHLLIALVMSIAGAALPAAALATATLSGMELPYTEREYTACLPVLLGMLLLFPAAAVTISRSRPERRGFTMIMLGLSFAGGAILYGLGKMDLTSAICYFCSLAVPSLVGVALMLHRRMSGWRGLYLLRALCLLIPFATLCTVLIIPVYRTATSQATPQPQPEQSR